MRPFVARLSDDVVAYVHVVPHDQWHLHPCTTRALGPGLTAVITDRETDSRLGRREFWIAVVPSIGISITVHQSFVEKLS